MEPVTKSKFPTEIVELPSKGLLYPEDNPLSSGKVEMRYMTAQHEDILTNQNYIKQGIVLDKLLQALIVSDINYDDLIVGDKNAIMIAARVLGYGKDYEITYNGEKIMIDLSILESKKIDESLITKGKNEFSFTLPSSGTVITYKLLTGKDSKDIEKELEGLKKLNKQTPPELSTRLKHMITSVDGNSDVKTIRDFVDNYLLARDSKELRSHIKLTQPDVNLTFTYTGRGIEENVDIPIGINFFWPDA
jgi:hypothetical protein